MLDLLQSLAVLIPFLFWSTHPTIGTYISGVLLSILVTVQSGYIDSTIVKISNDEKEKGNIRTWINANLESGKNIGQLFGYLAAWSASTFIGYKFAITIDSLSFLLSALITLTIVDNSKHELNNPIKESFSLLFKNKTILLLTASQSFLSFSIFVFNASYIFILKGPLSAPNSAIASLFVFQALMYIAGSSLASKFKYLTIEYHVLLRFIYTLLFVGFFLSNNYLFFILLNGALSFLISFTQPKIMSLFQSFSDINTSRSMGASRISLMAISGLLGSIFCGMFGAFSLIEYRFVFLVASCFTLASSVCFLKFSHQYQIVKSN